jgi:hypothetical protein
LVRFAEVGDPLNPLMVDTFQHTELALRHASKAVSCLWRRGASIWIDAHATNDTGRRMLGHEILPVLSFGQQLAQLVIADTTTATWGTNAGLFNRSRE